MMEKSTSFSKKSLLAFGLIFGFILNSVMAQNPDKNQDKNEQAKAEILGRIHMIFKDSDKDQNGQTSKEETLVLKAKLKDFYTKLFTLVQIDQDGKQIIHEPPVQQINDFVDKVFNGLVDKKGELNKEKFDLLKKEVEKIVHQN